ncbi:type IV pilus modification PilV family protein [Motilimonas pumila]|uniref:type IV pilus modification PilV family protein n=1 Tax=Motilimonas pumila TaxID=2303987 RepID=UPI0013142562|nr:prepilin-type N-terminal cleavage/methylation domain-containing protein [Motilimonas pumila]
MIFNKKNQGIGLIEVLVSLLVISVGVAGIISLQKHMRKKSAEAEEYLNAITLAQETFDDLRSFKDTNYASVVAAGNGNNISSLESHTLSDGITYSRTIVTPTDLALVSSGGITSDNQLKSVDVKLTWSSLSGETKNLTYTGHISPISQFAADKVYEENNGGSGGGTYPTIDPAMDPYDASHQPPLYVANYPYFATDQVSWDLDGDGVNEKYICASSAINCSDDASWGPDSGNFPYTASDDGWKECPAGDCTGLVPRPTWL